MMGQASGDTTMPPHWRFMRTREKAGNISTIAPSVPLDDLEAAALPEAGVVDARADDQIALVRLADVGMDGVGHDHGVEHRLERLGHQRLQRMAFQWQAHAGHVGKRGGLPAATTATLAALM